MKIDVSIGEIVDKLSILHLKKDNITDINKLKNINKEYTYLYDIVFSKLNISNTDYLTLYDINQKLWNIENLIRVKEMNGEFDYEFIQLARNVYKTNDVRAEIKKEINLKYNSNLIEEKSYT